MAIPDSVDYSQWPDVGAEFPELEPDEQLYAAYMTARERFFADSFGASEPADSIITPADPDLSLNWPGGGVYQFPPKGARRHWHYVTHGLSQEYELEEVRALSRDAIDERYSGLGFELVISTPTEATWAPEVLFNLCAYFLFDENARAFGNGSRIPCNGPLVLDTDTVLDHLLCTVGDDYPGDVLLPGGHCELQHLVGVTAAEVARAKQWGPGPGGSLILRAVLEAGGVGTASDPDRACLTARPDFETLWQQTEAALEADWTAAGWSGEGKA